MNIKSILIFTKPNIDNSGDELSYICKKFNDSGIKVEITDDISKIDSTIMTTFDLFVSFGGDGTFIGSCRAGYKYNKPIIGFSIGTVGFLAKESISDIDNIITRLKSGDYKEKYIFGIKVTNKDIDDLAINEVTFARDSSRPLLCDIDIYANNVYLNSYRGDGVIVSTPTGSTGYNLSLNGPILDINTDAFIITPLSSRSLSMRPIVMNSRKSLKLVLKRDINLAVDMQTFYSLKAGEAIDISISRERINILVFNNEVFYEKLRNKLNWGK